MSKSIIIDEAGLPKALTVDVLRTSKQGGGSEDWLPTDETNLVELDIGGSGTYRASDYNAYGISVARVTPKYGGGATSKAAQQPVFAILHTPTIREGGNPKYMSARLIKTNLQGGGTCLWVPTDEVGFESKIVDHSGTYTAHADGCYGYDKVIVSGVDVEITQDEDGDDVERITDGGEVTETKLPSYIRVTVLPQKIDYTVGETIDYTGLVVHAYTKSGIDMGVVPFNELILPVEKAGDGWADEWTDGHGLNAIMMAYTPHVLQTLNSQGEVIHEHTVYVHGSALGVYDGAPATYGGEPGTMFATRYNDTNYLSTVAGRGSMNLFNMTPSEHRPNYRGWFPSGSSSGMAPQGKFVLASWSEYLTDLPASTVNPTTVDPSTLYSLGESIPVQWHRPGDGRLLETSFNIYTRSA